ncbi:MAG: selenide, water dikinase SelD [Verrucomicrobiales bacterium]|nr:selenide, water dikinase SelD [Verrucomicrobiales bacterium]
MKQGAAIRHNLVLLGGGHAHVAVLKRFGMSPMSEVRLTLVSPVSAAPYSGMLPGLLAGHYRPEDIHVELGPLCRFAGAEFVRAQAVGLDPVRRQVVLPDRPPLAFDTLSINIGSRPDLDDIPGARHHGTPAKPVDALLIAWLQLRNRLGKTGSPAKPFRVVVVGGGAGSVELALALRHRTRTEAPADVARDPGLEFHLVTASDEPLPSHGASARRNIVHALTRQGVRIHADCRVVEALPEELVCANGRRFPYDALFWATHAQPPPWIAASGLATDADGFVSVLPTLQSVSHPSVFAAGDVASVVDHPRPKSGVYAVRQGPVLADNLRRWIRGESAEPYVPQSRALSLIATGDRHAIASYGPWSCSGRWVWRVKDWIDRRWIRQYRELPTMHPGRSSSDEDRTSRAPRESPKPERSEASPTHRPLHDTSNETSGRPCGGCAAKVPARVLERVLERLRPTTRPELVIGLEAPDDAAVLVPPAGRALVQTVDFFRTFVDDPHLFGRIATLHGLNDLFAMGAEPHSGLAIATLPFASPHVLEETLFQLLSGALAELEAHDAVLIGGHSAEGAELAFGMTLNGWAPTQRLMRKSGLEPGDRLVLTKPLGTGTLFAADMTGRSRGTWIESALREMRVSGREASRCFLRYGIRACTDISGFGLLGHLLEMLRASGVSATLNLDALPALDGALATLGQGLMSSLHPRNLDARAALTNLDATFENHPRFPLLFDPQTSGGLLAGVPWSAVDTCLSDLRESGYPDAVVVGSIHPPNDETPAVKLQAAGRHESTHRRV